MLAVAAELNDIALRVATDPQSVEQRGAAIAELTRVQRSLSRPGRRPKGLGAKGKILAYLREHVGEAVHGSELAAVAGIQEWPRRVRELRVEEGYEISELGGGIYRLESREPNRGRAEQWQLANRIRREPGSARARIEAFLSANVGRVVTREQVDYVAKIAEGSRRIRELRDEAGWPINSHIDEPDLQPGEYRLLSNDHADRRDTAQRLYPDALRSKIFERDHYTCAVGGRDRAKALAEGDSRFYLEVHHKVAVADELSQLPPAQLNDESNLITLCHRDHVRETGELQRRKRASRGAD